MKTKAIALFVLIFVLPAVSPLLAGEWPSATFTEVRAYAWPDDQNTTAVIMPDRSLKPGVINKEGALLTAKEVQQLRAAVTGKHPEYPVAACYLPHNAFVFYDADKKPVASVELCFGCRGFRIQPKNAIRNLDWLSLAAIFDAHHLPMGSLQDLQSFKKDFIAVEVESSKAPRPLPGEPPAIPGLTAPTAPR